MGKFLPVCVLFVLCMFLPASGADEILVGSLNDLTGATSDVGRDSALGTKEAITFINDKGGINGKRVQLFLSDFRYNKDESLTVYRMLKNARNINLLLQWGYADTQHLRNHMKSDTMVSITDSLFPNICDPKQYPFNFLFSTDHSTDTRAVLTAWYEEVWKKSDKWKNAREAGKKPKLVCFYQTDWEPGQILARVVKDQAQLLGMDVGEDQNVPLVALDSKTAVLAAKAAEASVIWHGNTAMSVATGIKDSFSLNTGADHVVATHGFNRALLLMSGRAGEGIMGTAPCAFLGMKVPGMDNVEQYCRKVNPSVPFERRDIYTVRAWAKVLLAAKALEIADRNGQLNGPGIKAALESLRDWSPFGEPGSLGLPPITITAEDHRPAAVSNVYRITNGKIELLQAVDMKKKFPELWSSWLGW